MYSPAETGRVYEYGLLEEARKSWDHFVSDKVVHVMNAGRIQTQPGQEIAKRYLKGALWLEVHVLFHGKRNANDMAIIGIIETQATDKALRKFGKVRCERSAVNGKMPMLVGLENRIQLPEQSVPICVSSIVRLKRFDNLDRLRVDMLKGISEVLPVLVRPFVNNRKLGLLRRESRSTQAFECESPCNVIKGRSQAIRGVSNDCRDAPVGIGKDEFERMESILNIILTNDSALVTCKALDRSIKFVKVYLRPLNLSFGAFERMEGRRHGAAF